MARPAFSSDALLTDIMQRPLDPGYAAAARRRAAARDRHSAGGPDGGDGPDGAVGPDGPVGRARAARPGWSAAVVVAGLVLGLVTGAGVAALRAGPLQAQDRAVLEAEVERRTAVADRLAADNTELRALIEVEQAAAIGAGADSLLAATEELGLLTGAVEATGEGVVVVLDDAPVDEVAGAGAVSDEGRVQDLDIQTVVNGLWAAGAEGVSVNGQRLTSLSTIRSAGDAVVVDLRQLARPYTITAVGDAELLLEEARTGSAGRWAAFLRDSYGVQVSAEAADDLVLPAASRLSLRHATGATQEPVVGPQGEDVLE
ncbi:DUF881 domain-containing protein [Aquipuribacter hungaricus]|uniref:DUF881 domain-containing protein n=1 Tax=Aquipuribacter hungaricus TaxID=545624 RepID=UPI00360A49A9